MDGVDAAEAVVLLLLEWKVVVNIDVNANAAFDSKVLRFRSILLWLLDTMVNDGLNRSK